MFYELLYCASWISGEFATYSYVFGILNTIIKLNMNTVSKSSSKGHYEVKYFNSTNIIYETTLAYNILTVTVYSINNLILGILLTYYGRLLIRLTKENLMLIGFDDYEEYNTPVTLDISLIGTTILTHVANKHEAKENEYLLSINESQFWDKRVIEIKLLIRDFEKKKDGKVCYNRLTASSVINKWTKVRDQYTSIQPMS
ncbi:991_t:CDS:2 [Entrophospora sp. SA101]|nr:991_t:CDS:2 [Entrophospora sp. SA101]